MKFIALIASVAAIRLEGAPPKALNPFDGLVHNADGTTSHGDGLVVNFEGKHDPTAALGGSPAPHRNTDITKHQGNGHVGGVWPYDQTQPPERDHQSKLLMTLER